MTEAVGTHDTSVVEAHDLCVVRGGVRTCEFATFDARPGEVVALAAAEVALVRRDLELAAILNRELALIGEEDGDMVRYHFYMGVVCQLEQRWREAEQHYLKALESAPDDANILGNLEVVRARLREK